jgi:hypothetical protein
MCRRARVGSPSPPSQWNRHKTFITFSRGKEGGVCLADGHTCTRTWDTGGEGGGWRQWGGGGSLGGHGTHAGEAATSTCPGRPPRAPPTQAPARTHRRAHGTQTCTWHTAVHMAHLHGLAHTHIKEDTHSRPWRHGGEGGTGGKKSFTGGTHTHNRTHMPQRVSRREAEREGGGLQSTPTTHTHEHSHTRTEVHGAGREGEMGAAQGEWRGLGGRTRVWAL